MIRIAKPTRISSADVIAKAVAFFGKQGEGLEEKERNNCCVSFEGAGGHVAVYVVDEDSGRMVEVETREFDYQAKQFLNDI